MACAPDRLGLQTSGFGARSSPLRSFIAAAAVTCTNVDRCPGLVARIAPLSAEYAYQN